ncbi:MAG: hypothetical protein RR824_08295 [Clostridia bacterium]
MKLKLMNKRVSNRALCWLCVAALLLSLMPLYAISFFNHACYDDFGFSILTHAAWRETGSAASTLQAAIDNTVGIRSTWEGTYATSFLSALQPALFGESHYWVATLILLTFFVFALWFFLRQTLVKKLHADQETFWMAFSAVAFVMIQFVPEVSEAFFWFNGGVAYTLLWSVMLLRLGIWLSFDGARTTGAKIALYALLLALTVVLGGGKYSTLLVACLADGLWVLHAFVKKKPTRFWNLAPFLLLLVCFAFSAVAPGNAVRAATLTGGMGAPKAILEAFYFGMALMGNWFSLPLLVVWALVAWQLAETLHASPFRFNHPVWITVLALCLFCAQLAPTLYTGNYIGDGRTVNTYFYTFVLMSCALVLYWVGWGLRRTEDKPRFAAIGTAKRDGLRIGAFLVAATLFIVGCVSYHPEGSQSYGPQNMAGGAALRSLLNGEAARYDAAMDERDAAMNDAAQPTVEMRPVLDIPNVFMGDALDTPSLEYVLSLYKDYYQKQAVTVQQEGE